MLCLLHSLQVSGPDNSMYIWDMAIDDLDM